MFFEPDFFYYLKTDGDSKTKEQITNSSYQNFIIMILVEEWWNIIKE